MSHSDEIRKQEETIKSLKTGLVVMSSIFFLSLFCILALLYHLYKLIRGKSIHRKYEFRQITEMTHISEKMELERHFHGESKSQETFENFSTNQRPVFGFLNFEIQCSDWFNYLNVKER